MKNRLVILAYLAVCILWGSTYLAIKIGIAYLPPFMMAGTRFIIAGLLMIGYAKMKKHTFPNLKELLPFMVVGLLMLAGGNGLVTLAEKTVTSGIAALFIALVPIYIAILEIVILRTTRLSVIGFIGLFLGFVGVYLLINPFAGEILISLDGAIMLFVAGVLWSIGSVYSKKLSRQVHIVPSAGIQMLSGGIFLIFLSIINQETLISLDIRGLGALFYLIFFGTIIGYSSYVYVLSKWPASKAGTYAYINPVVAVILGYIILGEPISIVMVFSSALILSSVYLTQKSKMKPMKVVIEK